MNVYLKKGLDKLLFGMNQEDVSKLLGNPNRSFINSDDKNDLIWEFTELKMLLTFYKDENNRLAYIRSSNPEISINNLKVIDQKIATVTNLIDANPDSWEKENYDFFNTYFNENNWLTLNVEYDKVTHIELGVPFKNEEEYDWSFKSASRGNRNSDL